MAKKKEVESIHVKRANNGGFTVRHDYKRMARKSNTATAGVGFEYPEGEDFVFGDKEAHKVLTHIAKHLNMGAIAREEAEEDKSGYGHEEDGD